MLNYSSYKALHCLPLENGKHKVILKKESQHDNQIEQ